MSMFEEHFGSRRSKKRRNRDKYLNGRIYFIQQGEDGPIKVGFSTNIKRRMETLQTANPYPLFLLGSIPGTEGEEKALHAMIDSFRMHGEWFAPSSVVLELVSDQLRRFDMNANISL